MNTAVSSNKLKEKYIDFLIMGLGFFLMLLALLLLVFYLMLPQQTAVSANTPPLQTTAAPRQWAVTPDESAITQDRGDTHWTLFPRAHFQVTGRILTRKTYTNDWQAEIAPLDIAIGWGELSDPRTDQWVQWRQSNRWYFYQWPEDAPYDEAYLRTHSSNIHIIPATPALEKALLQLHKDDQVQLDGTLVNVEANNGRQRWQNETSLIRTDTGSGACEILYVERLIWNGQVYQ